jgi:hypothetical protein
VARKKYYLAKMRKDYIKALQREQYSAIPISNSAEKGKEEKTEIKRILSSCCTLSVGL